MNDPEFRQMMKKFFTIAIITIAFLIPLFFIYKNKIVVNENNILTDIKKNKSLVIYITENNCNRCKDLKKDLRKVNYKEISKTNKSYNKIINKLNISNSNIATPAILYVKKGQLVSYIVDVKDDELKEFIKSYKLSK
jgi:cell division protein FtsX